MEAGESGIQGHLQLYGEAEAGLTYLKPRLRKPTTNPPWAVEMVQQVRVLTPAGSQSAATTHLVGENTLPQVVL